MARLAEIATSVINLPAFVRATVETRSERQNPKARRHQDCRGATHWPAECLLGVGRGYLHFSEHVRVLGAAIAASCEDHP
jgi:hypothetical protein